MTLDLRTRLFSWILPYLPGGTVAGASPDEIAAIQARGIRSTPITRAVMGATIAGVEVTEDRIPGVDTPLGVRLYRRAEATEPLPVVVHFRGGGWVRRDLEASNWLCSRVAKGARVVVASVDYRLAPQHPFPAAVEDAAAATRWIARHAEGWGGDGSRMAVMGDSAGANLAAVTAIAMRDAEEPELRHQVLLYPPVDLTEDAISLTEDPGALVLTPEARDVFLDLYLDEGERTDPRASPLLADDLTGLPPALIQVGDHDPLRDHASR